MLKYFASRKMVALVKRSMEELDRKTEANMSWGLGTFDRWDVEQATGLISFSGGAGSVATAAYQDIGTYSLDEGTWLWSWANASVAEPLTHDASLVRDYGAKEKLERLTTPKLVCTEYEAWELAAVACHLTNAQGVYRGPSGQLLSFMTFGEVTVGRVS